MEINQDQPAAESVNPMSQIAELLLGENDAPQDQGEQDSEADESPSDESTDNQEEVGEQESEDSDITWSSALGLGDDAVALDAEGNFTGVKVKVDGKEEVVPLKDIVNGFQFNKANTIKAQQLSEERKQFEQLKTGVTAEYTKRLDNVQKLTDVLANKFLADYNQVNWEKLRQEAPGEYAALQQDFNARKAQLQDVFVALDSEQQTIAQEQAQVQQQTWNAHLETQANKVIENNPDWRDLDKFKTAMSGLTKFVSAYGFTPEEFQSVYDARLIELIKDAQAYRTGKAALETGKTVPTPKFTKSTGSTKKPSQLNKLINKAQTAKGYQKRDAQTNAVAALLLGVK